MSEAREQKQKGRVLVVDDDRAFRVATRTVLEDDGYVVTCSSNGEEATSLLATQEFDLILSDMVMGKMNGLELLAQVRARHPELPVIMVTGFGSIQTAVDAMRLGATDYVTKPHNSAELLIKIRRALEGLMRDRELRTLREELGRRYSYGNIITRSERMREVLIRIRQVTDTDLTILIQGESGTGKELVARALHFNGKRRANPFVATNCSALAENLLESELFGYEKGAFTGAASQRMGRFEEAHTGTLFLDEIGDISPGVQRKLLRVLQEKTFERVGGNASIAVDTRVVVATNRNLDVMTREGDFREDLFYRLNVFPITIPPLRERLEDIPLLVDHFLMKHADLGGGRVRSVAPPVITAMMHHPWRGNVRELENIVKRAIITCTGETVTTVDLPVTAGDPGDPDDAAVAATDDLTPSYREYMNAVVRHADEKYLLRMLSTHRGNINQIARLMDVDRKTVYRKLAEAGIDPARFRE